ncbi:MAG: hypothetical protein Q9162_005710 [Coniocarpon cinnabarinum]
MPGKRGARALREHGLEKTDNEMEFTSWPQVGMINQKNYYTRVDEYRLGRNTLEITTDGFLKAIFADQQVRDYLKRDDQILVYRLQNEASRDRMTKEARDKDRARAHGADEMDIDDSTMQDDVDATADDSAIPASKTIIIHPGSQNLRIGFGSDVLPKTVPMCIARKSSRNESEDPDHPALPKRDPVADDEDAEVNRRFGKDFWKGFGAMSQDLKQRMRRKGKRIVPNCKEVAISFNKKNPPTSINEHNDYSHVDWTEIPQDSNAAPDAYTGQAALRIPDESKPRYKLKWPLRFGCFNEEDYDSPALLLQDFSQIIEDAIKTQLGITRLRDLAQYGCVFVIPDLYDKSYVNTALDLLFRDLGFGRVCFQQESLAASFGAGYPTCVIVDVGAQKTSICCVDEGMCIENSRINLRYGGFDVTQTFLKMLLVDHFPYSDINLNRRHDLLVAEEIKQKFCTMQVGDLNTQQFEFFLRAYDKPTLHFLFKAYDHILLAPMCLYRPDILGDVTDKVRGRRKLIPRSCDLYDGSPSDPVSAAQTAVLSQSPRNNDATALAVNGTSDAKSTSTPNPFEKSAAAALKSDAASTPQPNKSAASPGDAETSTPQPDNTTPALDGATSAPTQTANPLAEQLAQAAVRDRTIPIMSLDAAISLSIDNAAKGDDKKTRDFYGGILPVGGAVQVPGFLQFLEEELHEQVGAQKFRKEIMVAPPPREMSPEVLVWKGASVFGKLKVNDCWFSFLEWDRLGGRGLGYKCSWNY